MFNKIVVLSSSLLCVNLYARASEEVRVIRITQEVYDQHYNSFEKYVFNLQSKLWWGRKTCTVSTGAKVQGYDEFVIEKCIPASYPLFDRNKEDIKNILKIVGSQENIIHIDALLDKCSEKPQDINFIAHTTYKEGKRLEQLMMQGGRTVSIEDKDTFVAAGLFVRYWIENKNPL